MSEDHSGNAVSVTAKLQVQQRTKARERSPPQEDGGNDKRSSPRRRSPCDGGSLSVPASSTLLSSPGKAPREQGPLLSPRLSTSHALGTAERLLLHLAFMEVCFCSQLGTRECLCSQAHHTQAPAWNKIPSPFKEVEIVQLDGTSQWILWIFRLFCIHVICNYKTHQPQTWHQTTLAQAQQPN